MNIIEALPAPTGRSRNGQYATFHGHALEENELRGALSVLAAQNKIEVSLILHQVFNIHRYLIIDSDLIPDKDILKLLWQFLGCFRVNFKLEFVHSFMVSWKEPHVISKANIVDERTKGE